MTQESATAHPSGKSGDLKSGPREYTPKSLLLHNYKQSSQTLRAVLEEQVSSDTSLQVLLTVPLETAVHLRILLSLNPDINMTTDPISILTGDLDETVGVPNTLTPSPEQRRVWQVLANTGSAGTNHTLPRNSVDWKFFLEDSCGSQGMSRMLSAACLCEQSQKQSEDLPVGRRGRGKCIPQHRILPNNLKTAVQFIMS